MRWKTVEYKIISGRTVEVRRCRMRIAKTATKRGIRVRGNTSRKKIEANERDAVKRLAREINANFEGGDLWVTLTYDRESLPEDMEAAKEQRKKFLKKLRTAYRRETGEELRYIIATSQKDSRTGETVRLHHHMLLPAAAEEIVRETWPCRDDVTIRHLDGRGDYTGVARYIVSNTTTGTEGGEKRWSSSRNLKKPIYTEPVEVREDERVRVPRDCSLKEMAEIINEETGVRSLYVRYTRARKTDGHYVSLRRRC